MDLSTEKTQPQGLGQGIAAKSPALGQFNRLKDQFLTELVHELKSPLTAIIGLSTLLKEQKVGELTARQTNYADLIYQSGRRLMDLVNELLELTRSDREGLSTLNHLQEALQLHQKRPYPLVLILETSARAIENLTEQLRTLGYRVVIARSGLEALETARNLQPSAIFLNPLLPLLSGWDVLTLLKADSQTKGIRVIITGISSSRHLGEQNQADGFLTLPVEAEELQAIMTELGEKFPSQSTNLTILRLHPEREKIGMIEGFLETLSVHTALNHRILEADDLEQAELLAGVWGVDVIVLDGKLDEPLSYLRSLSQQPTLSVLPLVTLDIKTTEVANQIRGLSVFPCLIPEPEQTLDKLWEVIAIAARMRSR